MPNVQQGVIIGAGGAYVLTSSTTTDKWVNKGVVNGAQTYHWNAPLATGGVKVTEKDGIETLSLTGLKPCSTVALTGTRVDVDGTT